MDVKKMIVNLMPTPLVKTFSAPYVSGHGVESGITAAKRFYNGYKLHSTIDLLGEEVYEKSEVEENINVYRKIVDQMGDDVQSASISLKPTQLGIFESEDYCFGNIRTIIEYAGKKNIHITIDMEDHPFTDVTLKMFKALRSEFDNVGTVLQSRLFRTAEDIKNLHEKPCKVRMCIGIYNEPADIAEQKKPKMKEMLFEDMKLLLENGHYPEIATHDEPLIRKCIKYLDENNVPKDAYEFQMLMGVPRLKIQQEVVSRGNIMRMYVPFAENWKHAIAYCKRRLAANPMMAAYVMKNMFGKGTSK